MPKTLIKFSMLALAILFMGAGCVSFSGGGASTAGPVGMFVSTDKGEQWQSISSLLTEEGLKSIAGVNVYRLFEDPQDAKAMYLASRDNGLFYTYNNGKTWQQVSDPALSSGFIYALAVHPKNKCIIYATNGRQLFRTDDCSRNWKEMYRESRSNVLITSLAFNQFGPYEIYIGQSNGDLMRSYDSGNSWSVIHRFGDRIHSIVTSPLQEGMSYVITSKNGLYRTDDNATSWVSLKAELSKFSGSLEYRRHLLHPTDANTFYWISTYGILKSVDRGESWVPYDLIHPPGSANIYAFAIDPKNDNNIYYIATIGNRSTFYKSLDGGKNWITKKLPSGQYPVVLRVHPDNSDILYLGFTVPPESKKQPPKLY
ncbi:hypothetical protein KJ785_00160 [Patescibacteria group bacterium]|nr:hypothetical protein [Patescibacteria group bacterium]